MHGLFGTDGVRGIANDFLNCERAMQIGRAVGSLLSRKRRYHPLVLIGQDTRLSSEMLASAVTAGLCSVGADVIRLGTVSTPAVAFLVEKYKARAGIMISASHNPYEFNGIKIFDEEGFKFPDELEERIESIVLDNTPAPVMAQSNEIGTVSFSERAHRDYMAHIRASVSHSLDGLHIALDCANGSAVATAEELFNSLGARCDVLANTPDGVNINRDCGSTHLEHLARYVREHGLDCGIAFDGDADRCLAVDEMGNEIDGDMIMAAIALDMKGRGKLAKNTLIGTIMTNLGLRKFCEEYGIDFIDTKVGDRYVLERIELGGFSFGGEQSGHIIFRDFATTGDGQLTAAQLLSLMARTGKKLSELASVMKKYPQCTVNVNTTPEAKLAFYTDPDIKDIIDSLEEKLGAQGRAVVRPSGTEPFIRIMVEGEDQRAIQEMADDAAEEIAAVLARY
ncbi:MAG: phosphoglucosamine mutase [Clostridia bacterium]|nr:phosphoglucosamine mutase [Clostridia bacterium]